MQFEDPGIHGVKRLAAKAHHVGPTPDLNAFSVLHLQFQGRGAPVEFKTYFDSSVPREYVEALAKAISTLPVPVKDPVPAEIVDEAIRAHCRGDYDSIGRETAIRALIGNRACVLTTASYHNQVASLAAEAVNEGESLTDFMSREADRFGPESRYASRWWAENVLNCLHPVNKAGADQIEAARWWRQEAQTAAE